MATVVPSAPSARSLASDVPSAHATETQSGWCDIWKRVRTTGQYVAAGISLLLAEAEAITAQPSQEPPLTATELAKLAGDLGGSFHPTRAKAHAELEKRLDYDAMLLLAQYLTDPVLERKRRAQAVIDARASDIFKRAFSVPPEVDDHWLWITAHPRRPYTHLDSRFRHLTPRECARMFNLIHAELDQVEKVKKADDTETSDWEKHRVKLRMFIEKADLDGRNAVPLWSSDVEKRWERYQRTNPQTNRDQWNRMRVDAHMKNISDATKERVKFFMDESDTWRVLNKHRPKQKEFVPPEPALLPYYPPYGQPPNIPPPPGLRQRLPGLKMDASRPREPHPITIRSAMDTAETKRVLSL